MADTKSVPPSKKTGEPVDIHEKKAAEQEAIEKGKKLIEEAQEIVRKHAGPPGTP